VTIVEFSLAIGAAGRGPRQAFRAREFEGPVEQVRAKLEGLIAAGQVERFKRFHFQTLDNNTTATTYASYRSSGTGNGQRVVFVVVNGGPPNYTAIGFAGFFLKTASVYDGLHGNDSACAEYIGAWTAGVTAPAPGGSGAFKLRLFK
jgi:hypothetical protein